MGRGGVMSEYDYSECTRGSGRMLTDSFSVMSL